MSNDPDMFMVRHHTNDGHNLSVGEPAFLQHSLDFLNILEPIDNLHYPIVGGEKFLLEELHKLHPNFKHIVVTVGAKQGLLASLYALGQDYRYQTISKDRNTGEELAYNHIVYGKRLVHHPAPHWPSFPTLSKLSGMGFTSTPDAAAIRIVTSPNNPNGKEISLNTPLDIWDAAYFNPLFPLYGHTQALNGRMAVFSAAKMFGVSAYRIGWVGTNEASLAKFAAEYVEKSTTGVCILAQNQMAGILRHIRRYGDGIPEFEKARKILEQNATNLHRALDSYIDIYEGAPKGMFAWIKAKDAAKFANALNMAKVQVVPGLACGMTEAGWFRLSIGWQTEYLDKALIDLKKELDA